MDIGTIITVGVLLATAFYKLGDRGKKDVSPTKRPDPVDDPDTGSSCERADNLSASQTVDAESGAAFSCEVSDTALPDSKEKEPVDKRKLIVYSEIMKPKYLE